MSSQRSGMDDDSDKVTVEGEILEETFHSFIVARPTADNKTVVVKQCRTRQNPWATVRWRDEVEILKVIALGHKNVTQILQSNQADLTITLRHEAGSSLDRQTDNEDLCTLTPSDSYHLLRQISSALAFIHSKSIVHDDVKQENIMFTSTPFPHAVLIDFGAAFNQEIVGKDYWKLSGTPMYIPPEFLDKRKGPEGDIWAFGVTMLFVIRKMLLQDIGVFIPHLFIDPPTTQSTHTRTQLTEWFEDVVQEGEVLEDIGDNKFIKRMLLWRFESRITAEELVREFMNGV